MSRALVAGLADGSIYALLALGIVVIYRSARVLNLAHGHVGTFAVLTAAALVPKVWPWGAALAILISATVGLVFYGLIVDKIDADDHSSITVATIGLLLLLFTLMVNLSAKPVSIPSPIGGLGPRIFDYYVSPAYVLAFLATAVSSVALASFSRTKAGLAAIGASRDRTAAQMLGIPVRVFSAASWAGGCALASVAVLFAAPIFGVLTPAFATGILIRGLAAAIVGGFERPWGAILGGLSIGVVDSVVGHLAVGSIVPGLSTLVLLAIVVAVVMVRPRGLLQRSTP